MSSVSIPQKQWREFLQEFSHRHHGWLVTVETHDLETAEDVASRFLPLQSITLDLEDEKNPRINVTVRSEDRKSTRLNSSHLVISYAVFCLKKKKTAHAHSSPGPCGPPPCSH